MLRAFKSCIDHLACLPFRKRDPQRIAISADVDNLSRKKVLKILSVAADMGRIQSFHLFGNIDQKAIERWADHISDHEIPDVRLAPARGPNYADMHLAIDALDCLYRTRAGTFIIASSDTDFIPVISHLQNFGAQVIVPLIPGAPSRMLHHADGYIDFTHPSEPRIVMAGDLIHMAPEIQLFRVYESLSEQSEWVPLSRVGQELSVLSGSKDAFRSRASCLSKFIASTGLYDIIRRDSDMYIRYRITA